MTESEVLEFLQHLGARVSTELGLELDGAFYLLTLRLIPAFPFFLINLAMGLTAMRLAIFYLVSQVGMLPGTLVYVNAGTQLAAIRSVSDILSPGLIGSRTSIPAGVYTYYEAILATLVRAGFTYHLAHRALHAFGSMPLGFVQELFAPAPAGLDVDPTEATAQLAELADTLPHVAAMVASEIHDAGDDTLGWCDSQAEFEFTLDLLLDGLGRRLG